MNFKNFRKKIFSVKVDRKFIVIRILGVKLSLKKWRYYRKEISQHLFMPSMPDVRPNSVLLVEPNATHGEVIPGYVRYLLDLGYNVDVVLLPELWDVDPLCRMKDDRINCFILTIGRIRQFFSMKDKLGQYSNIFVTSHIVYPEKYGRQASVFDVFPALCDHRDKIIVVEHHLDLVDEELLKDGKVLTLADFRISGGHSIRVNPHVFGSVTRTPKNDDCPKFVTVGAMESQRRNYDILFDALRALRKTEHSRFKVVVIGDGALSDIDGEIRGYFDIRGWLDFPKMFDEIEKADFFLPLLDSHNPKHDRYLSLGTSGSFQLIYGFAKPCLINEKFAARHCFTGDNSLIYKENSNLAQAMKRAIGMHGDEYTAMQKALEATAGEIYARSLEVLRRVMG